MNADGGGESEKKIGMQTGDDCVNACVEEKKKDKTINGVTILQNGNDGCWCEKSMNKFATSSTYKTCLLRSGIEKCGLFYCF